MTLTVAQLGPGAPAAFADDVDHKCSPEWATREIQTNTGINIVERCEKVQDYKDIYGVRHIIWDWVFLRFKATSLNQRNLWGSGCASPGYVMTLVGLISDGNGGGVAGTKVMNYDCNGNNLDRPSEARAVIQYYRPDGWWTCKDSGWIQASSGRVAAYVNQYSQPDCGNGSYRSLAAGRVWSNTLGKWITRGWIATPAISLSGCGCTITDTEPEVTPTPTPATPD